MAGPTPARSQSADPRAVRVRIKIRSAAMELAEQRRVEDIGVADITARAGVSRQVFYQHFRDRDEAIAAAVSAELQAALDGSASASKSPLERIHLMCEYAAAHGVLFRNLYFSTASQRIANEVREVLRPTCEQFVGQLLGNRGDGEKRSADDVGALVTFLTGGVMEVMRFWMEPVAHDDVVTAEQLRHRIDRCFAAFGIC